MSVFCLIVVLVPRLLCAALEQCYRILGPREIWYGQVALDRGIREREYSIAILISIRLIQQS